MEQTKQWKYEDFHFPERGEALAFWQAQQILAKEDPDLSKYFRYLIYNVEFAESQFIDTNKIQINKHLKIYRKIKSLFLTLISFLAKFNQRPKLHYDILINPSFSTISRKSEQKILFELVNACLSLNHKVGIVSDRRTQNLFQDLFTDNEHLSFIQIDFIFGKFVRKILLFLSRLISRLDLYLISELLVRNNIKFKQDVNCNLLIFSELVWFCLIGKINFDLAILRCEWDDHSFSIKEYAKRINKPVFCFQHGVISHSLDIPVTVNRFFTFGEQSAQLLQSLNQQFYKLIYQNCKKVEFCAVGSIIDSIVKTENNFAEKTVLVIDQSVGRAVKFNGLKNQIDELNYLIKNFLELEDIKKIIIRPHPQASFSDFWNYCLANFSNKFEVSNPKLSLTTDVKRGSIAIGLFSGALVTCAASGLPSYFLTCEKAYYTPDLECFRENFTLPKDKLYSEINHIIKDEVAYLSKREQCLKASQAYYKNNNNCVLDKSFFTKYISTFKCS
ncbi:MAG: hypothetical protein QNJ41_10480 [Xenococcaceae cyanobacterium MO_188.B32]|nr:hypothetical protein [Xenococcaceae cyanobacterium MO_188.B32]